MQQVAVIFLQVFVKRLVGEIPVEGNLLIPLMILTEILAHKQELLSRMPHHEGVSCFQIRKLVAI